MTHGSEDRAGYDESLVVLHTGEGILDRHDMARFLDNNPNASAHATSDADGVDAPLVPYHRAAWTAGYNANKRGLQIEMCAFAVMTREQWLSEGDALVWVPHLNAWRTVRRPRQLIRHTALWVRDVAATHQIPLRRLAAGQLATERGVCGHADVSARWPRDTDHTDPGPGFPWDVLIADATGAALPEEDELAGEAANLLAFLATGGPDTRASGPDGLAPGIDPTSILGRVYDIQWALTKALPILLAAARNGDTIDVDGFRAIIAGAVHDAVGGAVTETVVPALHEALGADADVSAIAAATAEKVKDALAAALAGGGS